MRAILHPKDQRHAELVSAIINEKNLDYDVDVVNFDQAKPGNYCVCFDYKFKHCGDTEEGKSPTEVLFYKILEIMPNGHLKVDMIGDRFKIKKRVN